MAQRRLSHLPAAGEIVLFDRSWYNRAGVEKVMGFCTPDEHHRFLRQCPLFENMLIEDGIILLKYWFSVSDDEQELRFRSRVADPMRQWKLSPMDVESLTRWEDYSRAKDEMFVHTDIPDSPWFVVESDDKRRGRINLIAHLLSSIAYQPVARRPLSCRSGRRRLAMSAPPGACRPRCLTTRPRFIEGALHLRRSRSGRAQGVSGQIRRRPRSTAPIR